MRDFLGMFLQTAILWWSGRPWPPIVLAGTEARPTENFPVL